MSCIYEDSLKIRNHFFHTCICENDIKSTIFHKIDIIIFLTQRHILRTGKLFFPHKPACCLHLCRILSFKNFLPDCFRHHLLVYHKDLLSLIVQIRNQLTCCRITDLIRRTKGLFQIFGYFQCCRRYNNIFASFRCPFYCLKPIAHSIANGFFSFFFQFLSYFICCFQIAYILWRHSKDTDFFFAYLIFFLCKCSK